MFTEFEMEPLKTPDSLLDQLELSYTDIGEILPPYELDYDEKYKNGELEENHYKLLGARTRHAKIAWECWMLSCITEDNWMVKKVVDDMFYMAIFEQRIIELNIINNQLLTHDIGFYAEDSEISGIMKILENNCRFLFRESFVPVKADNVFCYEESCVSITAMIHLISRNVTDLGSVISISDLSKRLGLIIHTMNRICKVNIKKV